MQRRRRTGDKRYRINEDIDVAESTCVKCGGHDFEMKEAQPLESRFKLMLIQCSDCGGVIGVIDFFNVGNLLMRQAGALTQIAEAMNVKVDLDESVSPKLVLEGERPRSGEQNEQAEDVSELR